MRKAAPVLLLSFFYWLAVIFNPGIAQAQLCEGDTGIDTAIGCVTVLSDDPTDFAIDVFRFGIGIGGGIAFLLIVYAGFQIMTSQGNPEKLKAGQELLTSALAGLFLLIFSVFILELIGVQILGIEQLGT